jgi:hypothetical protein
MLNDSSRGVMGDGSDCVGICLGDDGDGERVLVERGEDEKGTLRGDVAADRGETALGVRGDVAVDRGDSGDNCDVVRGEFA